MKHEKDIKWCRVTELDIMKGLDEVTFDFNP